MIIRKFQQTDFEAVTALFRDSVQRIGIKYYNQEQVDAWSTLDSASKDELFRTLTENITYVAEDAGDIIGFGDMTRTGYVDHLFVHQSRQGTSVAWALFRCLEAEAVTLGIKELTAEVSIVAKPVAERWGFEVVEEQCKVHRGIGFTNYAMRKKL